MVAMNVVRETIVAPAPTTPSAPPMATAPVKVMHRAANGPTAQPVTTAVYAMTVLRVMIAVTSVVRLTAAPRVVTTSAHRSAHRPHGARTVAPTAAMSVAMTAAPWAMTTAPAGRMHALAPVLTRVRTRARLSPRAPQRPHPLPRSITTAASACPS